MTSRRFASPSGSAVAGSAPVFAGADVAEFGPEFPGCRPIRITRDAIADHESRIEYWDAATETAWVACEPNTVYHEGPGQVLSGLLTRIAAIRGAPILTLGAADLLLRNARGERQRILEADQVVSESGGDAASRRRRRGGRRPPAGRAVLRNRGLAVSERLAERIAGEYPNVLAAAALACRDEADLLARLDQRRRANRRTRTRDR